jgi:hypothetical protein
MQRLSKVKIAPKRVVDSLQPFIRKESRIQAS